MKYENTFKAIDQILWKEQGCGSELDYLEQKSWMLFLKYLDDLETEREEEAELDGKTYKRIVSGFYRWSQWAAPKKKDAQTGKMKLDIVNAMSGDDLIEFVDNKLFPYLKKFGSSATATDTLEYKIGEIFGELHNKIRSGFNMREIINIVDNLHFQSAEDKHEMTVLYESNIQRMGNAGRNGGEYYTPRPLIRSIIEVVDPKIGETIYDPACGSAGFLCEAFLFMKDKMKSVRDHDILQKDTFFGKEKKSLPYIIATMNMIFHGISAPNISHGNTLAMNISQIQDNDRKDVILANPPFGGNERGEVLQNFEIRTSETAYRFMQHFIKMLRVGGRAGIVIKNTFLSNADARGIRKMLLDNCNLHTILDLPARVFTGAGVKTVVLFFTKGQPTEKIWYYQLDKHFTKTQPLTEKDMEEFLFLQQSKDDSSHSWSLDIKDLDESLDLSVRNPNKVDIIDERKPVEIFEYTNSFIDKIKKTHDSLHSKVKDLTDLRNQILIGKIGDKCKVIAGQSPEGSTYNKDGIGIEFHQGKKAFGESILEQSGVWTTNATKIAEPGDILMSVRAPVGPTNMTDREVCIGRGLAAIRCNESVLPQFILYALRNIESKIVGNDGAVFNSINKSMIEKLPIPIISKTEQEKIVNYLDDTFSEIENMRKDIDILSKEIDNLKLSFLHELFE